MTADRDSVSPPPLRVTLAVAAVIVVAVVALVITGLLRSTPGEDRSSPDPAGPLPRVAPTVTVTEAVASLAVLRDWDRARSAAWARGDVPALRRIYLPGSRAGARDVGMLNRWVQRGLRVRRMTMQVLSVELRVRTERRIVLDVTDRLADAIAVPVRGGQRQLLPRDGLTTRRLAFRLTGTGWVLAAVYERPLASTALTSGSANS
ncbi:hypothetical protein [Nocardioides bizhenqiangii]|uniref:SnoaL-like domain-containing protein n=1 Tax=Nocardioides bizhenqiangii TaxID=3095076 RepID=A0ABZ0ZVZ2_9ACTN|nr:hypothetical protein [Nocardioides sp. HM61]WQQ28475.1 hypothetical protein SHK19_09620 [Nocardioides sp. HM61]